MKLDRELQKKLLQFLYDNGPGMIEMMSAENAKKTADIVRWPAHQLANTPVLDALFEGNPIPWNDVTANLLYLEGHGLAETKGFNGRPFGSIHSAQITSKGSDFLLDDGGLSAILGVVTIRFHDDTIRALLEKKIEEADLPDKPKLLAQLRSLPAESIKHMTFRLLDKGIEKLPEALDVIRTFLPV